MGNLRYVSLALGFLSFFGIAHAEGDTKLTKVRLGVNTVASHAALVVGAQEGIFRKYGFDVEVLPLASGAQSIQALAANQVDWAGAGIESTVVAWATKLPVKAYAMYARGGDSYGILVRQDRGIQTPADLRGKTVAVPTGTAPDQGLAQLLKKANVPPNSLKRINASFGNMGQMLVQGSVDAMVGVEPFLTLTEEAAVGKTKMLTRLGKEVQGGGFLSITDAWAKAHPSELESVVAALAESQRWVREHSTEAAKIHAEFLKVEPRYVEAAFARLQFAFTADDFTRKSLVNTIDYQAEAGLIPTKPDVEMELKESDTIDAALREKSPDLFR